MGGYSLCVIGVACALTWILARIIPPFRDLKASIFKWGFRAVVSIPAAQRFVDKSRETAITMLEEDHRKTTAELPKFTSLPEVGLPVEQVMGLLKDAKRIEETYRDGMNYSGCMYSANNVHNELVAAATTWFTYSNALHTDVYVCVRKMEAEIIKMTAAMLHGDKRSDVCGLVSSGGTESIILATKAHRDRAIKRGMNPDRMEILVAESAHSAYVKAANLLRVKLVRVPVKKPTMEADVDAISARINRNTFLVVASAPGFPHGVIDNVAALGQLCSRAGIGLHVDACLGGFVLPFAKQLGYPVPNFDFLVEGVTSISCDTHKYGYAPKGTSVVLFESQELRSHAFFTDPDWPGGLYGSATLLGSRPGCVVVGTWASMIHKGISGYMAASKALLETAAEIVAGLRKDPDISIIGDPDKITFVIPFTTKSVNIFKVAEALSKRHWSLNVMQYPSSVHLCVTEWHTGRAQDFLSSLQTAIREVAADPSKFNSKAPFYAGASLVGDRDVLKDFLGDVMAVAEDTV
ncbi:Glutamate decarboxylase/sphingosine phosphate lyase [Pelomyxa schiedti]|nr:Glutamate decarboxylase/sphingosine phosphate lyase [Pelomyxa schiedti]